MRVKVVFTFNGEIVGEYPFEVPTPESFTSGAKAAMDDFRRRQPHFDMLADGFIISFDKAE